MKLREAHQKDQRATRKGVALNRPRAPQRAPQQAKSADGRERLQKILSTAGITSRRKAEELILMGHITVNGKVVRTLGEKAHPFDDAIAVDGKMLDLQSLDKVYYILNKPRGFVTTTSDPQGRPTVMDLMTGVEERVYPVGRLDYASEGMIIFTNDGDTANKLMHPSYGVRRAYAVKVRGNLTDIELKQLRHGIQLSDGFVKPLRVKRGERLYAKEWIIIEIQEGKNLEIRRLFAALGYDVDRLRRISIGPLQLDGIPVGKYVRAVKRDIESILEDAKKTQEEQKNNRT